MTITAIPTKTDGDLGRVKADDPAVPLTSLDYQVPSAEYERIKTALIAVIEEAGLTDGSTVGSLRAAINAMPALASTTPADVAAAGAVGVGGTVARADHAHAHGAQLGGALHADAVAGVSAGFLAAADKTKLDGIAAGAVADHGALAGLGDDDHAQYLLASGTRALSGSLSVAALATIDGRDLSVDGAKLDGIAAGATVAPALSSTTPAAVGTAAVGVGTTTARADHVHAHGAQSADATMHAAATDTAAGFVELATVAECITGTDTARAVTPAGVSALHAYQRTAGTAAAPVTGAFALASYPSGSVVCVSTAGGVATGTLPTPAAGLHYTVKDIGGLLSTNALTIARTGGEKIEGLAIDYDFGADYGALHVVCDGTDWWVL